MKNIKNSLLTIVILMAGAQISANPGLLDIPGDVLTGATNITGDAVGTAANVAEDVTYPVARPYYYGRPYGRPYGIRYGRRYYYPADAEFNGYVAEPIIIE